MNYIYIVLLSIVLAQTTFLTLKTLRTTPLSRRQRIICDTSALIDGRIVSIARSGFMTSQLIIPKSVVRELQYMADKADNMKRERARYGLDIIQELQSIGNIDITLYDDGVLSDGGVDERLLVLAKRLNARLCTTDYNLNKVARTENITVVNVNEMAHALRPMHLPGEIITVTIVAPGQNKDQGVAYLDDGSMVVVDGGLKKLHASVDVETVRVLQTEAGRMVFAKMMRGQEDAVTHKKSAPMKPRRAHKTRRPQRTDP